MRTTTIRVLVAGLAVSAGSLLAAGPAPADPQTDPETPQTPPDDPGTPGTPDDQGGGGTAGNGTGTGVGTEPEAPTASTEAEPVADQAARAVDDEPSDTNVLTLVALGALTAALLGLGVIAMVRSRSGADAH